MHAQEAGTPKYAIPPLDSKDNWKERKLNFMATLDTKEAAQKYLDGMDATFQSRLATLGDDGAEFRMWDIINE